MHVVHRTCTSCIEKIHRCIEKIHRSNVFKMDRFIYQITNMNIIQFCERFEIRWQPVTFRKQNGRNHLPGISFSKAPAVVTNRVDSKSWLPRMTDYYGPSQISDTELRYRQTNYPTSYEFIILDTTSVQQIDIDSPDIVDRLHDPVIDELLRSGAWYPSASKRLPHIFVKLQNASRYNKRDVAKVSNKIDILNGQWSIARVNEQMMNGDITEISVLSDTFLKKYIPVATDIRPFHRIRKQDVEVSTTTPGTSTDTHIGDATGAMSVSEYDTPNVSEFSGYEEDVDTEETASESVQNNATTFEVNLLLDMLDTSRVIIYSQWIDVGIVLKCIGSATDSDGLMFDNWVSWSQAAPAFDHATCVYKWGTFNRVDMTIGSLRHWAKQDSPIAYARHIRTVQREMVRDLDEFTDYDLATFAKTAFSDRFVAVSLPGGKYEWYEFTGHRWVPMGQTPAALLCLFSEELYDLFLKECARCEGLVESQAGNIRTPTAADLKKLTVSTRVEELKKICQKLRTNAFKSTLLKECSVVFYDSTFMRKLDEYHHLLGFTNGVFDLDAMIFRDGRPDDYVSFSTNYDYVSEVDETIRADLLSFKSDIMSSDEMMHYLLTSEAYALHGDTWIQNIFIHTGRGGNGKSVNGVLMRNTFGDYFYAPDITMFTGRKSISSGGTSSEVAKAKGRRFMLSTEPEAGDQLQVSKIKYFTGGEVIQARALYKDAIEFTPQFSIHLQMNQVPQLSNHDGGIARRLKFIPYTFQFVDNPVLSNQKQLDTKLSDRFNTTAYAQQFMLVLIDYFHRFLSGKRTLVYPEEVDLYTSEYLAEEDVVGAFLQHECQLTHARTDRVTASDLFAHFRNTEYFRAEITQSMFGRKIREAGINKARTKQGNVYRGIKLVYQTDIDDDIVDDDEDMIA